MKDSLYLSRSFVEFGPFSVAEMQDFYKRGLLKDTDYVSADSAGEWLHVGEWASTVKAAAGSKPAAKPAVSKTKSEPAAVSAAHAKKAPAKKAAKKA